MPTIAPEFGNYGSGVLLEEALKEQVPAEEIAHVMEVLTAPEELSFYQEEEIELSETEDIKAHAEKYHWLKNSYGYCEHLPVSFFEKREKDLDAHLREKMEQHVKEAKAKKTEVLARYALSERAIAIAEGLHDALVWQDKRKREIVESIAYKNMFLEDAAVAGEREQPEPGLDEHAVLGVAALGADGAELADVAVEVAMAAIG